MNIKILFFAAALMLPLNSSFADPIESPKYGHHVDSLTKALSLNADQKAKLEDIVKAEHEKLRAIHEETHKSIEGLLNPNQIPKWEKYSAEHKKKHHAKAN